MTNSYRGAACTNTSVRLCLYPGCEIELEDFDSLDQHMKTHLPLGAPYIDINRLIHVANGQLDHHWSLPLEHNFNAGLATTTTANMTSASSISDHDGPTSCLHSECTSTFARASDLHRHMKSHQDGFKDFHCWEPGCGRNRMNGFYRRDKLVAHQKRHRG